MKDGKTRAARLSAGCLPLALTGLLFLMTATPAQAQEGFILTPEAPPGPRIHGREYIELSSDGLRMELGFDSYRSGQLIFDLVVFNDTPDSLELDPGDFYYTFLEHPDSIAVTGDTVALTGPSGVRDLYQDELEDWMDMRDKNNFRGALEGGAGILAAAIGFLTTEDPGFILDAALSTIGTASATSEANREVDQAMELVLEEQEILDMELFSDTTLAPGTHSSGFVVFPHYPSNCHYLFCFPAGSYRFEFVYSQENF